MKHITKTTFTLLLFALFMNTKAQTPEETQKWMEHMTPAEQHKMLAKMDGEWQEELTFWMDPANPDAMMQMKASCVNKMILGGRYQVTTHNGDFGGMPFEGISTVAYDNLTKKFISTWIDNMGTGLMYMEGEWDEKTKTVSFAGKMSDPVEGKAAAITQEYKIIDDNTQEITQYQEKKGKMTKTMYIKLTRK